MLLGWGLYHGELTSLLWGGAFVFAFAYTAAASALASRHPRARRPAGRVAAGRSLVFHAEVPPSPPFFSWSLVADGVHSPQRRFAISAPLVPQAELQPEPPRGRYDVTLHWELRDWFGFSSFVPAARWTEVLVVEPRPLAFDPPPPPSTKPGRGRPRRKGRQAGDPFDVREYQPGDDLRRLHWPLYAHSGTLFVRTAEPSPPPLGHLPLVLDTEAASEEELDDRVGRLLTWLRRLDAQGNTWILEVPSAGVSVRREPEQALAALRPLPLPAAGQWAEVTLVTGRNGRAARDLRARVSRLHTVTLDYVPPRPPRREWWKR